MATTIKPMPAAAIVSSDCSSWSNWYSLCGQRKVWLARISEASTSAPPPSPKMPKPGITKISNSRQDTPATNSETVQPVGRAAEVAAPEEQQEADGGHEAADADARRVQFDVERRPADDQQQDGHARRGQRLDQKVGPARFDQRRVVLQAVVLLELGEAVDEVIGQVVFFGLRAAEFQRDARAW